MSVEGMISEATAVKEAGVSARTLQRFSEAGYLTVQVKGDGDRLYSRLQLTEIFGSFQEAPSSMPAPSSEETSDTSCSGAVTCEIDTTTYSSPAEQTPMVERVEISTPEVAAANVAMDTPPLTEEVQRLRNLVALQERILDMKESEVQDLLSQRDWLKARVEKLEE